jgi:leucine-rich repeat transmembrane protein FLRT
VIEEENKYGGRLLDKPKQIPFQDGGHNLCLTIEELSPGWRSKLASNLPPYLFSSSITLYKLNDKHCILCLCLKDTCT